MRNSGERLLRRTTSTEKELNQFARRSLNNHKHSMEPGKENINRFFPHAIDRSYYYSDKKLYNLRLIFMIQNGLHYFSSLYYYYAFKTFWEDLKFLTYWGWTLVLIFQILVVFVRPRSRKLELITSAIHHSAFTIQIFIALMFWCALLPSIFIGFDGAKVGSSPYYQYLGVFEHSFPAATIFFDYAVSTVVYSEHGWFLHTGVVIAYVVQSTLMYNILGIYIYPTPLSNFKDWKTYVAMFIWVILNIVLAYYLIALKKELNRKRNWYWNKVINQTIGDEVFDNIDKDEIYEDIMEHLKEDPEADGDLDQRPVSDYINLDN